MIKIELVLNAVPLFDEYLVDDMIVSYSYSRQCSDINKQVEMQEAARDGDLVEVTRFLDQGTDVNEVNMVNSTNL